MNHQILQGDARHLPLADAAFDSCVTDPPYELGFMGKAWDRSGIAYSVDMWREVYRVLKPGAHLLAFGGTRTYHRMACAIEDAGFEIRDQMQWVYASGFPKSHNISKGIDKVLDLFSGIGGFSLAAHWLGWETIAFVEKEPFCQQVLRKNFGKDIEIHDDIFTFDAISLTEIFERRFTTEQTELIDMASQNKHYDPAVDMYDKGMSIQEIANFYEISRQAMWAILKRRGCVFRDNKRYGEENHFYRGTKADDHAQNLLEKAIARGSVQRQSICQECGSSPEFKDGRTGVQAHHPDYNKPLEVLWLCQKCHHQWHKENQAIPKKEAAGAKEVNRLYSVDIVTGGFP